MHPNHQYTAYLKTVHPDFWRALVKCGWEKLYDASNFIIRHDSDWNGWPIEFRDYIVNPVDLLLEEYPLIIDEAEEVFTEEFLKQINVEQIADWLMQEAEDRQITDEKDRQRIEEYIEFMRVLKLAA